MVRHRKTRRVVGALLIGAGALLMWLAPEPAYTSSSLAGLVLLVAGIVLEAVGIALEHRDRK